MFGLKPPLYYLPGKAPRDAVTVSSPPSPCPPSGVSLRGPLHLGDTPFSVPVSVTRSSFGGEVTFSQHLRGVLGSGEL